MSTAIWILKGLIASLFLFTGISKIFISKPKLITKGMNGLTNLNENQIKVIGFLEFFGVLGLILPSLLNVFPFLSDISAICFAVAMIVAGWIHYKLHLTVIPNILILVLCILIVYLDLKMQGQIII